MGVGALSFRTRLSAACAYLPDVSSTSKDLGSIGWLKAKFASVKSHFILYEPPGSVISSPSS